MMNYFIYLRWILLLFVVVTKNHAYGANEVVVNNLIELRRDIQRLPPADLSPRDKARLQSVADQLLAAEAALAHQSASMSPREQAMAEAQLLAAEDSLRTAVNEQGRSAFALFGAEKSARDASASAQPPTSE
jgi:hypothetical protein